MPGASPVSISAAFDSGNIDLVDASSPYEAGVTLRIRPDVYTELEKKAHFQWFHFKATGAAPGVKFCIENAGAASFKDAWPGTTVCYSVDRKDWKRAQDTVYDAASGHLSWSYPASAAGAGYIYFAYFAPYSWEQHQDLIARAANSPLCTAKIFGQTLDGRDLDLLTIGSGPTKAWVLHRQHPGESQAEWFAEGLIERLIDTDDALARSIRETCTVYIVPNMNPDGSVRGHLRTNACGANLNREWGTTGDYEAPTTQRSPEVYYILKEMDAIGVDFFVDVHGDEEIPLPFIAGMEGLNVWGPRLQALQGAALASYGRANPDMQSTISYEPPAPKTGNLAICSNQVAQRFDCLGLTLEQPFKDTSHHPDPERGWNPRRCKNLGANLLDVLSHVQPYLRVEGPFWEKMDARDAYVRPVEGSSYSTLVNRTAGRTYTTDAEVFNIDKEVAAAEQKIVELRNKRLHLIKVEERDTKIQKT